LRGPRGRTISASNRKIAIDLIKVALSSGARLEPACNELGITPRTYQRWVGNIDALQDKRPLAKRTPPKNKLTEEERKEVLRVANSSEYRDLVPNQIVPKLADQGIYLASESTFHRILKEEKLNTFRLRSKEPVKREPATHVATSPNQVWTWDITWLSGPVKGLYYKLYLILDMFSRLIVGYEVWDTENAVYSEQLVRKTLLSQGIAGKPLILHSDNGSPMKAATFLATLEKLGVQSSFSRPRVSNANPYSEALFKTLKYRPEYPSRGFESIQEAREWSNRFVDWYNKEHLHSALGYITPQQRHYGKDQEIMNQRKILYEEARHRHPERWTKGIRSWKLPEYVSLNPIKKEEEEFLQVRK
jgi:putative transposase